MKNKLTTWLQLGISNIATVAFYRILKKIGYYRFVLPISKLNKERFFLNTIAENESKYEVDYFSFHSIEVSSPPHWFLNPWNKATVPLHKTAKKGGGGLFKHWSDIQDFNPELGDIKLIWELSRFDWLPKMAWDYKQGNSDALPIIELWLRDWSINNPTNAGINWKCGQETSFRCLNLLVASLMIDDAFEKPSLGVLAFLEAHVKRIVPTLRYAMAQDNNHGTSEAAALFVVGEYLTLHGNAKQKIAGIKWVKKGRYWLENRVKKLVMKDGSFSQYSVTYHRLFLDSLSFVELIRQHFGLKKFTKAYYKKMGLAVQWLDYITDNKSGGAPNLGANDGAYLFNIESLEYRNFKPSIQLGSVVFLNMKQANKNISHPLLVLFKVKTTNLSTLPSKPLVNTFQHGGYSLLRKPKGFAMMCLPVFKFRPSHADAHHIDIWHNGINIIKDGGTYSYNTDDKLLQYFSGTQSHSTVQFDNRDQMPRLGRFLFGNWLKPTKLFIDESKNLVASSYIDSMGAGHHRSLFNTLDGWKVIDKIEGFSSHATLRWRLSPDSWALKNNTLIGKDFDIEFKSDLKLSLKLLEMDESLYYMDKKPIPILEITCKEFGSIESIFTLH